MRRPRGITLAEVIVLVVIGAVLLSVAVVAIQQARVKSRRQLCAERLKAIGQGLASYRQAHGDLFPFGTVVNEELPPERRLSWYVGAWPFVGDGQEQLLVDPLKPWDDPVNLTPKTKHLGGPDGREFVASEVETVPGWICPASNVRTTPEGLGIASYLGIAGIGREAAELPLGDRMAGIWGYDRQTPTHRITDGLEPTLLLAETARDVGPWTAGGPGTVRGVELNRPPMLGKGGQLGGLHPDGANVLFADGNIAFLSAAIDPHVLAAMTTIAGAPEDEPEPPAGDQPP